MLKDIIFFEVKIRLKRLSSLIYFFLFFILSFFLILGAGGAIKGFDVSFGMADKVYLNSPFVLDSFLAAIGGYIGMLIVAPLFGQSVYKDFHCGIDQILFSSPVKRRDYLWGRWLGAVISCLVIFSGIAPGLWLAGLTPWVQRELFIENKLIPYLFPYLTSVIPNVLIFGSLFFALACKFKKMAPVYVSGIILVLGYQIAGEFLADIDSKLLSSLLDPFGIIPVHHLTEYWSLNERNTNMVIWSHFYLYNRLIWLSVGMIPLIYTLLRFRPGLSGRAGRKKSAKKEKSQSPDKRFTKTTLSSISLDFGFLSQIKKLLCMSFFELRKAFQNMYFLVIYLSGVLFLFLIYISKGKGDIAVHGGQALPVTYMVLEAISNGFHFFILILITYYSGELIWRERDLKFFMISDALPHSNGFSLLSKIFCLGLLQAVLLGTLLVCGVLIQSLKGYFHFELALYLKHLFGIQFISWSFISLLALFVHIAVNNKYLGHFILILYYIGTIFLPQLGFEHHLYLYGKTPGVVYSDMNGYGAYLKGFIWFSFYWALFAAILTFLAYLLWPRGTAITKKLRWRELKRRLSRPVFSLLCLFCIATASVGSFIYYNTNVLNKYITAKERNRLKYLYEFKYKKFENIPQPALKKVNLKVDIFPYKREMKAKGHFLLKNKNSVPIQTLFVHYPPQFVQEFSMKWSKPASLSEKNNELNLSIYKLEKPLNPGEDLLLRFQVAIVHPGFTNEGPPVKIVSNGTFFHGTDYFPTLGYEPSKEISRDKIRRKYELQPKPRIPKINDKEARQYMGFGPFLSSRIDFEAILGTSKDQIAIAPGYLQREWKEGERRYFHYKMDHPIWNFYAFLSGQYAVKRDKWKDVAIEIYHHPAHSRNLERMIRAIKKGLEYFTLEFSPYQHKQFRIIEFPRLRKFAQSLPNTIPYSESVGFISDVKDEKEKSIDMPFYVTAHELAHQWWGHQVAGAYVQGFSMLSESMSQYAALMLMEKEYGPHKIKRFLKHELNNYLSWRGTAQELEQPLMLAEPEQSYIAYQKGSLIMYALKDYAGEKPLNAALRKYIKRTAFQEAPYTTTEEFVGVLKENLPKDIHGLIDDFFKYITLYDNSAIKASATKKANGKYAITLTASSKKWRADGLGKQTEKPMKIPVDIGIRNEKGDFIYLKKHPVNPKGEYEIEVDNEKGKPYKAGIDPLNKLIDRIPGDNEVSLKFN